MLYGTEENAKKEYHYSARVYEQKTDYIYLAEKALTKDEFQHYIKLSKEIINIQKKAPRDSDYESVFLEKSVYQKMIVINYMHFMIKQNHLMTKCMNL